MSEQILQFVVPGDLSAATGGYHYDRRIIEGLRGLGWRVNVSLLDSSFPFPTQDALNGASAAFSSFADDALVVIDGLALGAMPEVVAAHAQRLKLVALVHHPLALESGLRPDVAEQLRRSEEAALRSVRHVIVTGTLTRETLAPYGVVPSRVSVVEPGTEQAPLARGSHDGSRELLCVANVIPRKGYDLLIEALGSLRHLAWRLTCVGSTTRSPETVASLRRQIEEAELGERIRFVGELEGAELERCFAAADLFVLPTRHEGFGMVVAEALAHGLPVLGTKTGAIPDLVGAQAGIVVPPGDSGALREALLRLLTEPGLLASVAEGARAARARLPGWPQACEKTARVLTEVACQ